MTTFLPQPYPLWVAACRPDDDRVPAFRVVAWVSMGDYLDPLILMSDGRASRSIANAAACNAYGETAAQARHNAKKLRAALDANGSDLPSALTMAGGS